MKTKNIQPQALTGEAEQQINIGEIDYSARYRVRPQTVAEKLVEISKMDHVQFEHFLYRIFALKGYEVSFTPVINDGGADLVIAGDGKKRAVRCRLSDQPLEVVDVEEALTAMDNYAVDSVILITNGYFSNAAIKFAKRNKVDLIDKDALIDEFLKIKV